MARLALGIDIGTSGVRTAVLDGDGNLAAPMARAPHGPDAGHDANAWWNTVSEALREQTRLLHSSGIAPQSIGHLAVDGTSGSMVLVDEAVRPVTTALMYNSSGFAEEARRIDTFAPQGSIARGSSSALARFLRLCVSDEAGKARHLLHQADFVAARLAGHSLGSDDNNALKTGWDPEVRQWPDWFVAAGIPVDLLPEVHRVGDPIGVIDADIATSFGLSPDVTLHAGTTDSSAAFVAAGATAVGDAVTSLGTTLAIKLLSDRRIDDPARGIYSHRLGNMWLAGGASNTGGGVLAHYFSGDELAELSERIDPSQTSGLDYYPLLKPGERFPINDPALPPRLDPRPREDAVFLHGMLEGIARIEAEGYRCLAELGAPAPKRLLTAGGGARNPVWTAVRQRYIEAEFLSPRDTEAAIGAARLCLGGAWTGRSA